MDLATTKLLKYIEFGKGVAGDIMNYDSFNIWLSSPIRSKTELGCYLKNVYTAVCLHLTSCMSQEFISVQDSIIYNQVYGCLLFIFPLHQIPEM